MGERERLAAKIEDAELVRYFMLDVPTEKVLDELAALELRLAPKQDDVPFNAQVKGYVAGVDSSGDPWILKPCLDERDVLYQRICTLPFLLDHWMGTLSAPTTVFAIGGKDYRAAKVVKNSVQISSYNYMEAPFIGLLRADLVNRWLCFDEDRNPNNYLVVHNKKGKPFMVAIDFDKSDMESPQMKITGTDDKFGWIRGEKTRFLTLLRPDNFEGIGIETFDARLRAMMEVPLGSYRAAARRLVEGCTQGGACLDAEALADVLSENFSKRRAYIDSYFRKMFKPEKEVENTSNSDDYSMFGASFLAMHKKKG